MTEQQRIVGYLDGLAGQVAALARPRLHRRGLPAATAALDGLPPSVLDKAFKGEL